MAPQKRRALVIGGQFSGNFTARDLKKHFHVTVVDAKEFFEYTPGVLRAFVKPAHFDALSFTLQPVLERRIGVKFIWGEVMELNGEKKTCTIQPMFSPKGEYDVIGWDYCAICAGCNFGPFHKWGESLWFPTIHAAARPEGSWPHIDERFIEGRRRHILEEYHKLAELNKGGKSILVVGAGFIGVEWATEIEYYFPKIKLTIIDVLERCLGPLPDSAAEYCSEYMTACGIKEFYGTKYNAKDQSFWDGIQLPNGPDKEYVCIGVKASNYFMPKEVLSDKGPGGGGWIHMNIHLQVQGKCDDGLAPVWGDGTAFAIGDCNYGCIGNPKNWVLPPIPKISYPGEEQALHACVNIERLDAQKYGGHGCLRSKTLVKTWWPWGAGMFATSLGPHDACFVMAATVEKKSGYMVNWWLPAAIQKEFIETTKIDECKDNWIGFLIWHFVHHTPMHCWGAGRSQACCGVTCCAC
jgi:hypothetical protein